jgi:peptidoglycan/LPS O-acetylase OafA/YrhL
MPKRRLAPRVAALLFAAASAPGAAWAQGTERAVDAFLWKAIGVPILLFVVCAAGIASLRAWRRRRDNGGNRLFPRDPG